MKKAFLILFTMTSILSAANQLENKQSGGEQPNEEVTTQPVNNLSIKRNSGGEEKGKRKKLVRRNAMTEKQ